MVPNGNQITALFEGSDKLAYLIVPVFTLFKWKAFFQSMTWLNGNTKIGTTGDLISRNQIEYQT